MPKIKKSLLSAHPILNQANLHGSLKCGSRMDPFLTCLMLNMNIRSSNSLVMGHKPTCNSTLVFIDKELIIHSEARLHSCWLHEAEARKSGTEIDQTQRILGCEVWYLTYSKHKQFTGKMCVFLLNYYLYENESYYLSFEFWFKQHRLLELLNITTMGPPTPCLANVHLKILEPHRYQCVYQLNLGKILYVEPQKFEAKEQQTSPFLFP